MSKEDFIELKGRVTDRLTGGKFRVKLIDNDMDIICTLSGKMMMNKINIFFL